MALWCGDVSIEERYKFKTIQSRNHHFDNFDKSLDQFSQVKLADDKLDHLKNFTVSGHL